MLKFEKVFNMDKEKNALAVEKALENGRGKEYLNSFLTESQGAGVLNLAKAQVMITANYVCHFGDFKRSIVILPVKDITNVYCSNCFYGSYDYNFKAIAVETINGETFYFSKCSKVQNVPDFNTVLSTLAERCKANEGSLIA
ncbi:MAG: hypothetical protein J6M44_05330 [Butyrivibrio sp.]|uniref:hypothetical protein n=1 Tax=Butyrivibrio sp. TaxID=28121 RepID=UPI001B65AB8C|nr:hypothetical protein [Butyrivibrio sp.]MBP3278359.1 hypothetical protein [Butyrivibrio sp.]MBP3782902.1 hypothetical protein [Butyrivibrio sp.]